MASSGSSIAAGSAPTDSGAVIEFVKKHSERYKELAADDPATTVEGCFPPEEVIGRTRVMEVLDAMSRLHSEHEAMERDDKFRILHVRDKPYYESLEDLKRTGSFDEHSSSEESDEIKVVVDYLQLPKELIECAEMHFAIEEAKAQYQAALDNYDADTASEPRPRIWDALSANRKVRLLIKKKLTGPNPNFSALIPGSSFFDDLDNLESSRSALNYRAFCDGLWGEPLSESGKNVSVQVLSPYCAGCIVADRDVTPELLRKASGAIDIYGWGPPSDAAAATGKLSILMQLEELGLNFSQDRRGLSELAAKGGHVEILKWLHSKEWMLSRRNVFGGGDAAGGPYRAARGGGRLASAAASCRKGRSGVRRHIRF
jgi:hypothetical protein